MSDDRKLTRAEIAEELENTMVRGLDDLPDDYDRGKFARVAAGIAEDRYNGGSRAARVAVIIAIRHGAEAARDFVKDLEHHEGF